VGTSSFAPAQILVTTPRFPDRLGTQLSAGRQSNVKRLDAPSYRCLVSQSGAT
jgi:hypothetical protein